MQLKPIAETVEADGLYGPFMWGDVDLYDALVEAGRGVGRLVPECVALSVSLREHGVTLTLATTTHDDIEATLSLPVPSARSGATGFDLYASAPTAFVGHHDVLADLLGASTEGAVEDGDLDFASRRLAQRAPEVLQESTDLAVASVMLARARDEDVDEAEQRLRDAAVRAAIPLKKLLAIVCSLLPAP